MYRTEKEALNMETKYVQTSPVRQHLITFDHIYAHVKFVTMVKTKYVQTSPI